MLLTAGVLTGVPAVAHGADCSLAIVACIDVDFPAANQVLGASLNAGSTTTGAEQFLTVSSTNSWGVRIASDLADGRMKEWDGSAYVASPKILTNPLQWGLTSIAGVAQTPSWTALSSSAATVVTAQPAHCLLGLLCGSSTVGVRNRLTTSFSDRRVSPRNYRVRVTYTVSHGF